MNQKGFEFIATTINTYFVSNFCWNNIPHFNSSHSNAITANVSSVPFIDNCVITWNTTVDSNVLGGVANLFAYDVDTCKQACIDNSACTGLDFDRITTICYLLTITSTGKILGVAIGVDHYEITRVCRKFCCHKIMQFK